MVDDLESHWHLYESKRWVDVPRDTEAPYYCAPGRTPEETFVEIAGRVASLVRRATRELRKQETMPEVSRIRNWHRFLFTSLFPGSAGRFRTDDCRFGVWLPDGPDYSMWTFSSRVGAPGEAINPRLEKAVAEFQQTIPAELFRATPERAGQACAQLFTNILEIHPFVDGNMRLSNTILLGAIRQFDYDPRSFLRPSDIEFAAAYSTALRPDDQRSVEPLAALIANRIREA